MLFARDYENNEYPILAKKIVTSELNGNEDLELHIPQQKNNNLDLLSIDKLWEFDYNNIIYKAVNVKRQTRGNSFNLNVRAMPLFYWEFSKSIIHENHDGSHTANSAFRTVFDGSGFNFALVDFSPSVTIEGFGKGANRLELFKRLLDRYNYEFEIQGRTVYMKHLIGNDTNYMYKYRLNASNVSENIDASSMFTYIRGFGDFEEGEEDYFNNAGLQDDYLSPLAEIVTKPGQLPDEGPPIVDGRITQVDTLKEAMRKAVEESLAITIEGTLHDVRQMGYDIAVPVKGDRVWLHDERINLEQEVRLHKIVTTYDEKDNIIACDVTFGSQSIGERHKANINTLSKRFADLLTGKLKLPIISLEQIGMDMINAIHAASSEIIFGDFGMQAISKTNPNHVFGVNSEGWYISQDGGRTPKTIATAQGIYADALFAGTLWLTNEMNIESADGYLNVTGSRFVMRSKTNTNNAVEITPEGVTINGFDGREFIVDGIMRGQQVANIQRFNLEDNVHYNGRDMEVNSDEYYALYVVWDRFKGRYLDLSGTVRLDSASVHSFRHFDIQITRVGTGDVIATLRKEAHKTTDPLVYSWDLRIDLQTYFNTIVDYRRIDFYINARLVNALGQNMAYFRLNQGEFYG
ncbi:phage tail spike protein [Jeotgalicoccus marinus]|uniref:phage tail spike protein n=1 Tax=Jeotgalicoccus marinus TaxID=516700 RepID=UPI00041D0883|nr:phage tail spike protein [Jeotgalicoccus marinus]